jgi:predicted ribosome-associated RNA-binding protein Tma20
VEKLVAAVAGRPAAARVDQAARALVAVLEAVRAADPPAAVVGQGAARPVSEGAPVAPGVGPAARDSSHRRLISSVFARPA